jgi:hypothetical protein
MIRLLVVLIFISLQSALATLPIDIVFDIDQTILTRVHRGPMGDLLADPNDPAKGILSVNYTDQVLDAQNNLVFDSKGMAVIAKNHEQYRIFDGLVALMEKLKVEHALGHVRVSFFSGGSVVRNKAILSAIKLGDGSSLSDLAGPRILGRPSLVATGGEGRFSERYKKDLSVINSNLDDVVLIDDVKGFATESQVGNILWTDDRFPYPERSRHIEVLTPELLSSERNKIYWLTNVLEEAIQKRLKGTQSFSTIVQSITRHDQITPFSPYQNRRIVRGKTSCETSHVANILSELLK